MKKLFIASCLLCCTGVNAAIESKQDASSYLSEYNSNPSGICLDDVVIFSDGTQICGKLSTWPAMKYSFGTMPYETSDIAAIAFYQDADQNKIQLITLDGQIFIGSLVDQKLEFSKKNDGGPKSNRNDSTEPHSETMTLDPNKIKFIILSQKKTKKTEETAPKPLSKLHSLKLKNGDQLMVSLGSQKIALTDGFEESDLYPNEIVELFFNGGIYGDITKDGVKQKQELAFAKNKYLEVYIPNGEISLKLPWDQVECITCASKANEKNTSKYAEKSTYSDPNKLPISLDKLQEEVSDNSKQFYETILAEYLVTLDMLSSMNHKTQIKTQEIADNDASTDETNEDVNKPVGQEESTDTEKDGENNGENNGEDNGEDNGEKTQDKSIAENSSEDNPKELDENGSAYQQIFADDFLMDEPHDMIFIPSGRYMLSVKQADQPQPNSNFVPVKSPHYIVEVPGFYIDENEVTNLQYMSFIKETGYHSPAHWIDGKIPQGQENIPVINVSYQDAEAYAGWIGKRLPTEIEWEAALKQTASGVVKVKNLGKYAEWTSTSVSINRSSPLSNMKKLYLPKEEKYRDLKVTRQKVLADASSDAHKTQRQSMDQEDHNQNTTFRLVIDVLQ